MSARSTMSLKVLAVIPPLTLALCGALVAQPHDPVGASDQVTVVSTSGGPTLTSDDGGRTWRIVDPQTARDVQARIGRSLQGSMTGAVSVTVDPAGSVATVDYTVVRAGETVVTLHNAQGAEVLRRTEQIAEVGRRSTILDITSLIAGMYALSIRQNGVMIGGGKLVVTR